MRFTGILGDAGSGKTTLMTAILYGQQQVGQKIIANYKLNFSFLKMPFSELAEMPAKIDGSTIGMDELGKGADSYEFFTARSKRLATLVMESRKRRCSLYYTVQRFGLIAARLRAQTEDFYIMQDLDRATPHCKCESDCICEADGYKCAMQFLVERHDDNENFVSRNYFDGSPYKALFNTHEIIW